EATESSSRGSTLHSRSGLTSAQSFGRATRGATTAPTNGSTMTAPASRVALIGYGLGGSKFHAPLISTTPGLTLAAIVTHDPARRERAQRDYPGVRLFDTSDDLW